MNNQFDQTEFDIEVIERARAGSAADARTALVSAVIALGRFGFYSPYLQYLQECLEQIISGVDPDRALGLKEPKKRGAPKKHNDCEVMAVDLYLRDHLGYASEEAISEILEKLEISDRSVVQKLRRIYDGRYSSQQEQLMEQLDKDDLLEWMTESVRKKVSEFKRIIDS